ncbi:small GTP-binding protein domain [Spizellomyces punctatus DAOM BR117]|uniref:Small GTP-binding protein domain n=1 Tax=Spizellomyces punctatus (strain DAOM BR117) TaxID=645134 RepID=A0A0L0HCR5_SPIPD|nr:small GTP-binding protein domain [Spizellomyces punctatus DAOM BR117]KNC99315.1 small GTP-binding protein domain [Spizellomyces punctatus DAOM BR117]|eukprot:XP_016607355.1 small GTP-binding protein domain [Spizellomyces punctatus DAOM BR117]
MTFGKIILRNKCVVLGSPTTGKTALTQLFHSDGTQYAKTYAMTLHCDTSLKPITIPDTQFTVDLYIHDIGCSDLFAQDWVKYTEGATSYMIVYDVTNADSFKDVGKWMEIVSRGAQGVLVANKTDQTSRRVVSTAQGEELASRFGLGYFECSAATNTDVEAPFYYLASTFHQAFMDACQIFERGV